MSKTAIRFTNFSEEDFVGVWDKVDYPIASGDTMMFPSYLAKHFAKHLIDRELTKKKESTNTPELRAKMEAKCLGNVEIKGKSEAEVEVAILNNESKNKESKTKEVKEVKKTNEVKKEVKEDEFAGLNESKDTKKVKEVKKDK